MTYIKVKDKDNLYRDSTSNGIINADIQEYNLYVQNYKKKYDETKKIVDLENDLNHIKDDIQEIKSLLRAFINGSWQNHFRKH